MAEVQVLYDREEYVVQGRKFSMRIENLTPIFPELERVERKRRIEANLYEIYGAFLSDGRSK